MLADDLWSTFQAHLQPMPGHTVMGTELFGRWRRHIAHHPRAGYGNLPLAPAEFYRQLAARGYRRDPQPGRVWFLDVRLREDKD